MLWLENPQTWYKALSPIRYLLGLLIAVDCKSKRNTVIHDIWLLPPLAIARLGGSSCPLNSFEWASDNMTPNGSGKTTIVPALSFHLDEDGALESFLPSQIQFRDNEGLRPVAPFFELHGRWDSDSGLTEGPLTSEILASCGISLADLVWVIRVSNLKPFNLTRDPQTRIDAIARTSGNLFTRQVLMGQCPAQSSNPLVPIGTSIPLGKVQLAKPNDTRPELRLRFTPAKGFLYGPTDLRQRAPEWPISESNLYLNKTSSWCSWLPTLVDPGAMPGGQYAHDSNWISLGLVDDVCDGTISCQIESLGLTAQARIVTGPPKYAPDRRPFISLADDLKDRVDRENVYSSGYYDDDALVTLEVADLMQRINETTGLINVDVFNNRVNTVENMELAFSSGVPLRPLALQAFRPPLTSTVEPFALTEIAREQHRRFASIEVFRNFVSERPDVLRSWIREPVGNDGFYTKSMPAVMRGSDGRPLHLTRRQYQLLITWASMQSSRAGKELS